MKEYVSECGCSKDGSVDVTCNEEDGQCQCKPNYSGDKCYNCSVGFFNYPQCDGKSLRNYLQNVTILKITS